MTELNSLGEARIDEASAPFLGQWNRLVSTTNWEKGRIIHDWRQALVAAAAPASEHADEAWSTRVGNVTGQHIGRLRRVYERFDALRGEFPSLYWSHFQAALDWDDAEMWLEGAYQSGWSVAEMRRERAAALGSLDADQSAADAASGWGTEPIDEDADAEASAAEVTVSRAPQCGHDVSTDSDIDS